jgi:hypothetical protein
MDSADLPARRAGHGAAFERLREQAVALRRAGRSRREIKALLAITSNATLDKALRGEPPPEWTRRPNAKDEVRARARELREQGLDYEEIAGALGVSKSSVSLWGLELGWAPGGGFEPPLTGPKPAVMPLDHPGSYLPQLYRAAGLHYLRADDARDGPRQPVRKSYTAQRVSLSEMGRSATRCSVVGY